MLLLLRCDQHVVLVLALLFRTVLQFKSNYIKNYVENSMIIPNYFTILANLIQSIVIPLARINLIKFQTILSDPIEAVSQFHLS